MADHSHRPIIWSTLEEYDNDPEVLARLGGGEWNSKPAGFADKLENLSIPDVQVRRRTFLKLSGFAAVLAAATGCEKPAEKILPYVTQPEEIIPGVSNYYSSTCQGCAAGCGILAETREGRPIKLEGNPAHPVNEGTMCARGQATIFELYDPDRLRAPIGANGEVAWEEADAAIAQALRGAGNRAVLLTGTIHGPAREALLRDFLAAFPGMRHVMFDSLSADRGDESQPRLHFGRSAVTVLLGADPISEGPSPVEYNRGIGQARTPRQQQHTADEHKNVPYEMGRLYAFEPIMSVSGMNADYRYAVRPSDLLDVTLALANELGVSGLPQVTAESLNSRIKVFKSGTVDEEPIANAIRRAAEDLRAHRGRSIVHGGGLMARTPNAREIQAAVYAINEHLGNIGETIDYSRPSNQHRGSTAAMTGLLEEMQSGNVDALLIAGTNPAYALPANAGFEQAVNKVKLRVSFSTHKDETASLCHFILPDVHFLENWGDAEPYAGIVSIQQPTIGHLWNNRPFEQSLINIARAGGSASFEMQIPQPAPREGEPVPAPQYRAITWHEYLQNTWREQIYAQGGYRDTFENWWYGLLRKGVLELPAPQVRAAAPRANFGNYRQNGAAQSGQFELAAYVMSNTFDGRHANNPYLLELPDPVTRVSWDNYVGMHPAVARDMKLNDGDMVKVTVGENTITGPVRRYPGLHPSVLAVGTGWGRTAGGSVLIAGDEEDRPEGFNAFALGTINEGQLVNSGLSARIEKAGGSVKLADVQGHNYMRRKEWKLDESPRQIVQATSLEKLNASNNAPQPVAHIPYWENGENLPDIWNTDDHHYDRHKWVMAIDLNTCTGCNACMIACQVENNVPVVGKREVLMGREMHWIRIDRYYKGHPDNPEVAKQPMLCQHCDNAPCETVCPVLATVHSSEGINIQAYNRCVGTRYCANNCPYKVRRFNFYHYSKFRKGPHDEIADGAENRIADTPLALALNPDVTVRSKGIMEKCTFCQQRLREAKDEARRQGRNIPEGHVKVACQQACPPQAIHFGDRLNPAHNVNVVMEREYMRRGYGVLSEFNVRPNVTYLAQVMNRESLPHDVDYNELHHGSGHGDHGDSHGEGEFKGLHDDTGHPTHHPLREGEERHEHEHPIQPGTDEVEVEGHISLNLLNFTGVGKS